MNTTISFPSPYRRNNFSLFEVAITLVLLALGIFGVMGLIPVSLDRQTQALGKSFATDIGERILRIHSTHLKNGNWSYLDYYADKKPSGEEPLANSLSNESIINDGNLKILPGRDNVPKGVYHLEQLNKGVSEFSASLRLWKSAKTSDDGSLEATLKAEISWPPEADYDSPSRKRETFWLEVVRAPQHDLGTTDSSRSGCSDPNNLYPPEWPTPNFTWVQSSGPPEEGVYFCSTLGRRNEPIDQDGTPLENLVVTVCEGPAWLKWNGEDQIFGIPEEAGTFTWKICVSDGCFEADTNMTITITSTDGESLELPAPASPPLDLE